MNGFVLYQTADRGFADPRGERGLSYVGVTYRIPRCDHDTIRQLEWERPPHELIEPICRDDGSTLLPEPDAVIERFDTVDRDTGDMLVMYRIPCRTVDA